MAVCHRGRWCAVWLATFCTFAFHTLKFLLSSPFAFSFSVAQKCSHSCALSPLGCCCAEFVRPTGEESFFPTRWAPSSFPSSCPSSSASSLVTFRPDFYDYEHQLSCFLWQLGSEKCVLLNHFSIYHHPNVVCPFFSTPKEIVLFHSIRRHQVHLFIGSRSPSCLTLFVHFSFLVTFAWVHFGFSSNNNNNQK